MRVTGRVALAWRGQGWILPEARDRQADESRLRRRCRWWEWGPCALPGKGCRLDHLGTLADGPGTRRRLPCRRPTTHRHPPTRPPVPRRVRGAGSRTEPGATWVPSRRSPGG